MRDAVWWIVLVVMIVCFLGSLRLAHKKRLNLRRYIVYLLLDDAIRADQKATFEGWILSNPSSSAADLGSQAQGVIEGMAEAMANGDPRSLPPAHAMIWQVKQGKTPEV